MPGTGLKVCVLRWGGVCKPILVFSLGQAEQFIYSYSTEGEGGAVVRGPVSFSLEKLILWILRFNLI